jgi:hypothetical protein
MEILSRFGRATRYFRPTHTELSWFDTWQDQNRCKPVYSHYLKIIVRPSESSYSVKANTSEGRKEHQE